MKIVKTYRRWESTGGSVSLNNQQNQEAYVDG